MTRWAFVADRTAVLFLGVAAGCAIGYAFGTGGEKERNAVVLAPEAAPVQGTSPAAAPPPPTGPANPETPAEPAPKGDDTPVATPTSTAPVETHVATPAASRQLVDTVRAGQKVRIGVFGDSFGDGVWSALYRLLSAKDGYEVAKYSQQSTGFTRYKRLNLEEHDEGQIAGNPVDIAVISFGANDVQGIYDGKYGALMSPHWQEVIGQRIDSYIAMLRRHGAIVYWVGLPRMRDPNFDSDTSAMAAFYRQKMAALGVPYVDIRPLTVDAGGGYEAYYTDSDGQQKLLRANDGVHMSMNGYVRISRGLAQSIRGAVDKAKAEAGPATSAPPAKSDDDQPS